jgi:hypothetical protein
MHKAKNYDRVLKNWDAYTPPLPTFLGDHEEDIDDKKDPWWKWLMAQKSFKSFVSKRAGYSLYLKEDFIEEEVKKRKCWEFYEAREERFLQVLTIL